MLNGMQLMRLRDTARSTLLGMRDNWPGPEMSRLATFGFVVWKGDPNTGGWQATPEGFAELKTPENVARLEVI